METLFKDIRYGIRSLLKRPGFTAIAVITLAVGIGANVAIFSVVNGVLWYPLPYQNSEQLVMLWEHDTKEGNARNPVAPANFVDWRKQNEVCSELGYFTQPGGMTVTGSGEPERLTSIGVSHNLFSLLGVAPVLGHQLTAFDDKSDQALDAVLSYGLWQRRYGGDRGLVGKPITLDGIPFTVAGVMPANFQLPEDADLWYQTLNGELPTMRGQHFLRVVGRLKAGTNLPQAQAGFTTIARRLAQQYPDTNSGYGVNVVTFQDQLVGEVRTALLVLLGAVGFVLLIACANVANLLLTRAMERQKEISIRAALGASRVRLMRQLLAESWLLALAGGTLGLLIAVWGVDLLAKFGSGKFPGAEHIGVDRRALAFTLIVTTLTGIIFGLMPAWFGSKTNLQGTLREAGQNAGGSPQRGRLRNLLVVSEVALALVLLAGGGLMIRTLIRLQSVDLGFETANVLTMQFSLPGVKYGEPKQISAFYKQLTERVATLPGVRSVGAVSRLPLAGDRSTSGLTIEGRPIRPGEKPEVHFRSVTPGYFRTLGIPLLSGRELTDADTDKGPGVVLINKVMAKQYWPNEDATGKRIKLGPNTKGPWLSVAGVVGNALNFGFDVAAKPEVYVSYQQVPQERMRLVVRTTTEPHSLVPAVREAVRGLDQEMAFSQVATMDELLAKSVARRRLITLLLAIFSVAALLLAAVGIYGVMSYAVRQRTHEVGIRMALGARPRDVLGLVVKMGMKLALGGTVIGLAGAFALTRLMSTLLFGIAPTDVTTFVTVSAGLLVVALIACYIPARRATKVDPLTALRYD